MVLCTGSIAYDYILTFKGRFKDHILLDKTHILNLSFLVDDLQKRRGGVAGNYAYNLALLGQPAAVLATAGTDATEYRDWLEAKGVDCRGLRLLEGEMSATGFTTTDMDDNQLTGYYGGAMWKAAMLGLEDGPPDLEAVIIGPNDPGAMKRLVGECPGRARGRPDRRRRRVPRGAGGWTSARAGPGRGWVHRVPGGDVRGRAGRDHRARVHARGFLRPAQGRLRVRCLGEALGRTPQLNFLPWSRL